jgi:PTH1 family peptidyl-tRNA hydrolase
MADIFDLFAKISKENTAKAKAPIEWLLVGLGNPGRDYVNTRHNAGFMAIDRIAKKKSTSPDRSRFKALTAECEIAGKGVLLMLPQTYMNLSGEAVREAAQFYKIAPEHILVISDDINLDVGRMRLRTGGSDGGQKGLRSIINLMGCDNFPRLRIGVGKKPHPDMELADWVLSRFTEPEMKQLDKLMGIAAECVELYIGGKNDEAVRLCNAKHNLGE